MPFALRYPMRSLHRHYLAKVALLCAVYFATAKLGLKLDAVSGFATLVWPPTGIALAALVLSGYRLWPGIALGAFLVNLSTGAAALPACGIAIGNTLEALLGAYWLRRFGGFRGELERIRDVLALILLAAAASTTVSATVGVSTLWLAGIVSPASYAPTWIAWWIGDMLGDLIVAPLLLTWATAATIRLDAKRIAESAGVALLLTGSGLAVFGDLFSTAPTGSPIAYMIFPPLIWAALRFGPRGAITATSAMSILAVWGTAHGLGPFASDLLSESLLLLQIFMGVAAVTILFMAAAVAEREASEKIARKNEEKISQLYEQTKKQAAELEQAGKLQADFTAMIVHDLRSPLSVVMGAATTMGEGLIGAVNIEQKKWLARMAANSRRLMDFVTAFLDLSKIEAGHITLHKEEIDLSRLLERTVDDYEILARNKNISLVNRFDPDVLSIHADAWRIEQLLSNLLSNAIKFTREGGRIEVGAAHGRGATVTLWVKDNGKGISSQEIERIFEKYRSGGDAKNPSYEGTGLGLAICKMIVEAHQGRIWVESEENEGTTFFCSLPVEA
jgi:signal transduction histidine kinase